MKRGVSIILLEVGLPLVVAAAEANGLAEIWGLAQRWRWFNRGGPIMHPILACLIVGLEVFFERLAFLRRKHLLPPRFVRGVTRAWQRREYDVAWRLCQQSDVPLARMLRAGLLKVKEGSQEVEQAVEGMGSDEAGLLEANLRFLGVISNIAPMLGFLGTVTGMISAFDVIAQQGTEDARLLVNGVSEALITTEFGLFVGIPL